MPIFWTGLLILLYTMQSFFCRRFSDHYKGDANASSSVFSTLFGFAVGLSTLLVSGFEFSPSRLTWILGLLNGAMLFFYNCSMVKATQKGPYSFLAICMLFGGLLGPLALSVFVLHQPLKGAALAGFLLMLVSFVVLNAKRTSFKGTPLSYYVWCAVTFFSNGIFSSVMAVHSNRVGPSERSEMVVISYLFSAILAMAILAVSRKKRIWTDFASIGKKAWLSGIICWASASGACNLVLYVLSIVTNVAVFYAVENGGVLILSLVLSMVVLRERVSWLQAVGMVLSVVSIVLLSL